jgi:hypothetical protein
MNKRRILTWGVAALLALIVARIGVVVWQMVKFELSLSSDHED